MGLAERQGGQQQTLAAATGALSLDLRRHDDLVPNSLCCWFNYSSIDEAVNSLRLKENCCRKEEPAN